VTAWARPTVHAPEPAYVDISFERGAPTAINDVSMPLLDLVASLSTIAGAHLVDRPSRRGIVDSAAVAVLMAAHQALRASTSSADAERFSALVARQYAELVASGLWASPLREALDAYVETLQARMTGRVRLKLFKGHCDIHDDALVRTV
jgi:argininosuccinate synthase